MKDIKGFEGLYAVTDDGRVWSYQKYHTKAHFLAPAGDKNGYLIVGLHKNKRQHMRKVHRLVAGAYIPNRNNLPQVNHINGIKTDNRVENLEWCTGSHNQRHGRLLGLIPNAPRAKLTHMQVLEIRSLQGKHTQSEISKLYGVSQPLVGLIHRRVVWKEILQAN